MKLRSQKSNRGQTALETAFVFSMLLFMTFSVVNFAILFHTKNIATYAAFMAARSYQVMGDMTGNDNMEELLHDGKTQRFLEKEKTVTALRVAEDIFTCALPWMTVPPSDAEGQIDPEEARRNFSSRCQEGNRKYETLNVGKTPRFLPFNEGSLSDKDPLEKVIGGFSEAGREPLRYGILNIKYRTPILFDLGGMFAGDSDGLVRSEVYVPVLLNPGLNTGISEDKGKEDDFDKDFGK